MRGVGSTQGGRTVVEELEYLHTGKPLDRQGQARRDLRLWVQPPSADVLLARGRGDGWVCSGAASKAVGVVDVGGVRRLVAAVSSPIFFLRYGH